MHLKKSGIIKLKSFIGFQHNSSYHTMEDIETLHLKTNNYFTRIKHIISFDFSVGVFNVGENMVNEVQRKIKDCDVAIFDISENNANVFFEAGFAFGRKKHVVFLKCLKSVVSTP